MVPIPAKHPVLTIMVFCFSTGRVPHFFERTVDCNCNAPATCNYSNNLISRDPVVNRTERVRQTDPRQI